MIYYRFGRSVGACFCFSIHGAVLTVTACLVFMLRVVVTTRGTCRFKYLTAEEEQHFESAAIAFAAAQIGSPVDAFVGCGGGHTHVVERLTTDRLMVDTAWKVLKAQISETCAVRAMIAMRVDAEKAAQQASKHHHFSKVVQKAPKVLPPRSRTEMHGLRLSAEDMVAAADDVLQSHKASLQANDKNPTGGKLKAMPALGSVDQSAPDRPPVVVAIGSCHYAARAAGIANGPGDNNLYVKVH